VSEGNARSIRLLEKLGFEADGVVRAPGSERDVRLFAAGLV
jgi:RimJ/RimL family protein N-acetyltransferase